MDLHGKKILVTGADGFIGSHLTEALVQRGCDVRALVLYNAFNSRGWIDHLPDRTLERLEVCAGDVRDPHGMRMAMDGCSVVFHLAALIGIPYSYHSPDSYVDTNIRGTLNVLQAARELGVEKLIQTSTSEVYGTARFVPITESHPLQPQSPYSASKIAADQMALSFYHSFGTPVAICRPFNTFGPRQSCRAVIPTIITQLAAGTKAIRLGALHPTRDFCFVSDTAAGFIAIAESDQTIGEVINLGTGFDISVGNTARLIAELMDASLEIDMDEQRLRPDGSEVERLQASSARAHELTRWTPRYTGPDGLRNGLLETIAWYTDPANLRLYRPGAYAI